MWVTGGMTRRTLIAVAAAIVLFREGEARAQSAQDKAAAQVLFDEGRGLMQEKQYALACPKFFESNHLDAGLGTVLWLADCYEKNGQSASAWGEFREAADIASRDHDPREKIARDRADRLAPTLSKMTIVVGHVSTGMTVKRDVEEVGRSQWGLAVPVDPGPHKMTVTAPHKKPWLKTVFVPAGVNIDVALPTLTEMAELPPSEEPDPSSTGGTPGVRSGEPPAAGGGGTQRAFGGVFIGVGVAGLAAGGVLAILARVTLDDGSSACKLCGSEQSQDFVQGHNETIGSIASFVGGGTLALTGLIVILTAPSGPPKNVSLLPWAVPRGGGVGLGGTFE
jgi:hypothetical protein